MNYLELDTPALLIDKDIMLNNCRSMQDYADLNKVALRPHTKTHKMSKLALMQEELGAKGIAVAKVGEAKLLRIRKLAETIDISFGLDSIAQADLIEKAFEGSKKGGGRYE